MTPEELRRRLLPTRARFALMLAASLLTIAIGVLVGTIARSL